jgi:hypothetical protein
MVERNSRIKGAHFRLRGVEGGAQFGVSRHRLEVPYHAHGVIQRFGQPVERVHAVLVGALAGQMRDGIEARARLGQQFGGGGPDIGRADAVERNAEFDGQERVGCFGTGHSPFRVPAEGWAAASAGSNLRNRTKWLP